jgi:cytochrome c553
LALLKNLSSCGLTLFSIVLALTSDGVSASDAGGSGAGPSDQPPSWAFVWDPSVKVPAPDETPVALSGSSARFSWKQARDLFAALDWHPEAHPAMPDVVANGRKPDVRACGSCHRVEGTGGPENASLAGLPVAYFIQQIADIKSGARRMSGPERPSTIAMLASAKAMTDDEIRAAADYFAGLARRPVIKVVETDTIPKTGPSRLFYVRSPEGGTEPLGERLVEMPDDVDRFELRDSRATFTVYVPVGSLARGEALVKTGGSGTTNACSLCHGTGLKGLGNVPAISGRSPTYIVRQLWEFQHGNRSAGAGALMQQTVEKLSRKDMIDIAAYVGSLDP